MNGYAKSETALSRAFCTGPDLTPTGILGSRQNFCTLSKCVAKMVLQKDERLFSMSRFVIKKSLPVTKQDAGPIFAYICLFFDPAVILLALRVCFDCDVL